MAWPGGDFLIMKVKYTLITLGQIVNSQVKELDGPPEANLKQIEDDQYTGMDPAELARDGKPIVWIEARIENE